LLFIDKYAPKENFILNVGIRLKPFSLSSFKSSLSSFSLKECLFVKKYKI